VSFIVTVPFEAAMIAVFVILFVFKLLYQNRMKASRSANHKFLTSSLSLLETVLKIQKLYPLRTLLPSGWSSFGQALRTTATCQSI
jgi:hypothetical protein